ncbi:MAG: DNA-directed RNA polymerase specialized sigma24 family protein [Verrucomicrobiales bacterium]
MILCASAEKEILAWASISAICLALCGGLCYCLKMRKDEDSNTPDRNQTGVGLDNWSADFPSTHWSMLFARDAHSSEEGSVTVQALAEMGGRYWYPVYAYLRKRGHSAHDAQDLVQGFFTELLSRDGLAGADREKGRFRSYLLGAVNHYVSKTRARESAQKRGGGQIPISIDQEAAEQRFQHEPSHNETPEKMFNRNWALTLIQQILCEVEKDYIKKGKGTVFETLKIYLSGESDRGSYVDAAEKLQTTEVNVRTLVKRLRQRFRDLLRSHVGQMVDSPEEIDEEVRFVFQAVS